MEADWDELQAQKYRAWEHHLALTILATWFVAEAKLDWARQHPRDPILVADLATDRLPDLSVVNVPAMLRAAMPLPDLTADRAAALVVQHLVNRTARAAAAASASPTPATTPDRNLTLSR